MLALGFEVGGARYAVRCAELLELVPRVPLREVPHAPAYIPGQFTYRGAVTPVVDLVRLMTGGACAERLSSRILIAAYAVGGERRPLGLLAERVTEPLHLDGAGVPPGIEVPEAPYLGELHFDGQRLIQLVRVAELLPPELSARLFSAVDGGGRGDVIDGIVERLLEAEIGLDLDSVGESSVRAAVAARMAARGLREAADYLRLLESREERTALIDEVVIPETWFFRDRLPFEGLAERAAAVARTGGEGSVLRVLSAPCSSGEEPYSVAMALLDAGIPRHRFRIDGIDISERLLARARKGTYGSFSFRGGDVAFRERHFTRLKDADDRWQLSDAVRGTVHFKRDNLLAPLWLGSEGPYDFIFCRNLLIYLTGEARKHVLDALARVLAPEGRMLVGHAEALDSLDARFVAVGERGAFSYALRGRPKEPVLSALPAASKTHSPATPANAGGRGRGRSASRRTANPAAALAPLAPVAALATGAAGAVAAAVPAVSAPPARLAVAPPPNPLERAAGLADRGELEAAAALCDERLRAAGDDAEAHQLLGLIRQAQGDVAAAELCFSRALYCDPDRAPAMVHLALLLERRGESSGAALLRRRAERRKEPK